MTEQQSTATAEKWQARDYTGREGWIYVMTRWSDEFEAYVTTVSQMRGARWCPLEYHTSTEEDAARTTHAKAKRRHPKNGNYRTVPRTYNEHNLCTRCGEHLAEAHQPDCRD